MLTLVPDEYDHVRLPSPDFEEDVTKLLTRYLDIASNLEVEAPYSVSLTFMNVTGARLAPRQGRAMLAEDERHTVQEDTLMLPEIVIEERDSQAESIVTPLFETVWNCFGFSRPSNYDDQAD